MYHLNEDKTVITLTL